MSDTPYSIRDFLRRMLEREELGKQKNSFDHDPMPEGSDGSDSVLICEPIDGFGTDKIVVDGRVEHPATCGHVVWLSPHSQVKIKNYPKVKTLCGPCAYKLLIEKGGFDD